MAALRGLQSSQSEFKISRHEKTKYPAALQTEDLHYLCILEDAHKKKLDKMWCHDWNAVISLPYTFFFLYLKRLLFFWHHHFNVCILTCSQITAAFYPGHGPARLQPPFSVLLQGFIYLSLLSLNCYSYFTGYLDFYIQVQQWLWNTLHQLYFITALVSV